jgi:hypothetical protein
VAVPINFLLRRDELAYVLAQSDAAVLVTMDRFRDLDYLSFLDQLAPGWESAGGPRRAPDHFVPLLSCGWYLNSIFVKLKLSVSLGVLFLPGDASV